MEPLRPVPDVFIVSVFRLLPSDTPDIVEAASLAIAREPDVIVVALVVSVVADVAKPDTAPEEIAIIYRMNQQCIPVQSMHHHK